jgi:ribonuclease P protein component
MLSQKHRLSRSAEVKQTTARGRSFFNTYFVIKSAPSKEPAKVTVIVSTKVSKKAVDRNRIKRVIREEIRKEINNIKPGNYAFLVKPVAAKAESKDLRASVAKSMIDSKMIK